MWEELGISAGTAIIILIALYFIIKYALKRGIIETYNEIKDDKDKVVCALNVIAIYV